MWFELHVDDEVYKVLWTSGVQPRHFFWRGRVFTWRERQKYYECNGTCIALIDSQVLPVE
jgi:hypothetical protein